jgi:hypothetical protein
MEVPIEKATVIVSKTASQDRVTLQIDMPDPMGYYQHHKMYTYFDAKKNTGAEYVAQNFPGIPVEIINT